MKASRLSTVIAGLAIVATVGIFAAGIVGAGGSSSQPGSQDKPSGEMVQASAPIDGLSIRTAESAPPQYLAELIVGLPSGCAKPGDYKVERSGSTITIMVWNLMPADPNTACTMIYGQGKLSVPLGTDFTPGQTYVVAANERKTAFTAQ